MKKIMVNGAVGQIGSELVFKLRKKYGAENVIAFGRKTAPSQKLLDSGPFDRVDVNNIEQYSERIKFYNIGQVYQMAAILSGEGEKNPQLAFKVNLIGMYNLLEIAREMKLEKINIPSSIAVFGPDTPQNNTPNETILRPTSMYGVTKVAGELLCNYYFQKYAVDVRGLRFPGILSDETLPGGGTTDYAVEIFYEAIKHGKYECFLDENQTLPMMYMPDALKAMTDVMDAPIETLKHHADYNLAACSFSPRELAAELTKYVPGFEITYKPDFRNAIAASWPNTIDDSAARAEWGWSHDYDMPKMVEAMFNNLKKKLS
jgi:threonine 3-dehydrogenase